MITYVNAILIPSRRVWACATGTVEQLSMEAKLLLQVLSQELIVLNRYAWTHIGGQPQYAIIS